MIANHPQRQRIRELFPLIQDVNLRLKHNRDLIFQMQRIQVNLSVLLRNIPQEQDQDGCILYNGFATKSGSKYYSLSSVNLVPAVDGKNRMLIRTNKLLAILMGHKVDNAQIVMTCGNSICANVNHITVVPYSEGGRRYGREV